jgi:hypothetical protein
VLKGDTDRVKGLGTYVDGKMKRYSLMFSVNGGAFAIAKLMTGADKSGAAVLLGNLRLWHLAVGSIIFTVLMVIDIWKWGRLMKDNFLGDLTFGLVGHAVLFFLGVMIVIAWSLVALG